MVKYQFKGDYCRLITALFVFILIIAFGLFAVWAIVQLESINNKPTLQQRLDKLEHDVEQMQSVNDIIKTYNCNDSQVLGAVWKYSKDNQVEPTEVAVIIALESSYLKNKISRSGAKGYMGVMDFNFQTGERWDDTHDNIRAGVRYYRKMLDRFGSRDLALAAYNAGPSRVIRAGGVPDIPETIEYLRRFNDLLRRVA